MSAKISRKSGMLYRRGDKILKLMREQAECDEPFPDELHDISSLNGENDVQQMDNTIFEDMDATHSSNIEDGEINHFDEIIEDEEDCIRFWTLLTNQSIKTRRSNEGIMDIPGGKYWYNGIWHATVTVFPSISANVHL
ncbi:uncharacterized protein LOC120897751 isoform X2 [Anopheles arabiensis]|uniref:uncharacterized protein LOC120897751 isoform X2 n=1 Tax=Anopheles arabiensis TaxID=7173 RepID=UPI001AAD31A3|nr:uncharacterized protein LOC120897751 isoform X2 [Anopheles arabiensis]